MPQPIRTRPSDTSPAKIWRLGIELGGNRIFKAVDIGGNLTNTYYVKDAQCNVMGVYKKDANQFSWQEQHLYGSSRIGIANPNFNIQTGQPLANANFNGINDPANNGIVGLRTYELSNLLGNVLSTISDKKIGVDDGSGGIDHYIAEVLSQNDYYPGGMLMPGRKYNAGNLYRYGFNGKENDNEVMGEGNQQDYGMRIYDPRLVRFLSADPIGDKYPELTPYQFASNTPIWAVDLDGLEAGIISYGYRVSAFLVTGSVGFGAAIDHNGNIKLYTQWSGGVGLGLYAGGGVSLSLYPKATSDQIMGSGLNAGGSVGIPGLSASLDINFSLQKDDLTKKINDFKLGASGGIKPLSIGPGGAEVHVDYSEATPFFSANLFEMPKSELIAKIEAEVDDTWFLSLSKDQINNFVDYMYATQSTLKKMYDENNPRKPPPTTSQQTPTPQKNKQQQPAKQKAKQKERTKPKPPQQQSTTKPDSTKEKPLKAF